MTELREQSWNDVVLGDERLREFPPVPDEYRALFFCCMLLWPIGVVAKGVEKIMEALKS